MESITSKPSDTIIALCTPAAPAALAVIRISGPEAFSITSKRWQGKNIDKIESHTVSLGYILDSDGNQIDNVLITKFKAPHSFTGENTIEISCHGSTWIAAAIIRSLIDAGARHARHGEFSQTAFLNGRLDLTQAEAIADIIATSSKASATIAIRQLKGELSNQINTLSQQLIRLCSLLELELDFSEEDVTFASRDSLLQTCETIIATLRQMTQSYAAGNAFKNGHPVAIAGIPNAGKSTLLNTILHDERAIVSDIPGTTRDIIEDTVEISGILFRISDTAGLRITDDKIENTGIKRTIQQISRAAITIILLDATVPLNPQIRQITQHIPDLNRTKIIPVINKTDLAPNPDTTQIPDNWPEPIPITANRPQTIRPLIDRLVAATIGESDPATTLFVTNQRHYSLACKALEALTDAHKAIEENLPADLISQHIRYALGHLSEITGQITSTTILHSIFASFCIGK